MRFQALVPLLFLALSSFSQITPQTPLYTYLTDKAGKLSATAINSTGTDLNRVNGCSKPGSSCSTGFSGKSFPKDKVFSAIFPAIEFTITPNKNYTINAQFFTCDIRRSGSGTMSVRYAYSIDSGKHWIDQGTDQTPYNGSCGQYVTAKWDIIPDFQTSGKIMFRVYGYNAASKSGILQIANAILSGLITQADKDGDGYAPCVGTETNCDCNDNDPKIHPNAEEICNEQDDNCIGGIDENLPKFTYYKDNNGDGYGEVKDSFYTTCYAQPKKGYVTSLVPKTDITGTTTIFKINPYLFEGMAEQIWVKGGGKTLDISTGLYFARADSLGLNGYIYSGASPSWHYHTTKSRSLLQVQDSMGWVCCSCAVNKLCTAGKCSNADDNFIQGMCCEKYAYNFLNKTALEFCPKLKLKPPMNYVMNAMVGAQWETDSAIARGKSKWLYSSLENNLGSDYTKQFWPTAADYVNVNNPKLDKIKEKYPSIKIIGDAGHVLKKSSDIWNGQVKNLHADAFRQYMADSDMYRYPSKIINYSQLRDTVLKAVNYGLPKMLEAFKQTFPGKQISPAHTGTDNRLAMVDINTMNKQLWIAGQKVWELNADYDNNGIFLNSDLQSIKYLAMDDPTPKNDYRTNVLLSELYHGSKFYIKIETSLDNYTLKITGGNENGIYTIVVVNFSDTEYTETGITLDNYYYANPTSTKVLWADKLEDTKLHNQTLTGFTIKPRSVTQFTFQKTTAAAE